MTPRRESTTHGPRLDEELKRETSDLERSGHESRAQDARELEGAADEEPHAEHDGAGVVPRDPALARRQLSRHIRMTALPATREELLEEARANDAPAPIVELIEALPGSRTYATVYEVWEALGGELEPGAQTVLEARRSEAS